MGISNRSLSGDGEVPEGQKRAELVAGRDQPLYEGGQGNPADD